MVTWDEIEDIMENMDIVICQDYDGKCADDLYPVFYIGQYPEPSAGLNGCDVTPSFKRVDELKTWVIEHFDQFKKNIEEYCPEAFEDPEGGGE